MPLEKLLKTFEKTVTQTQEYILKSEWIEPKPTNLFINQEKFYPLEQLLVFEEDETICSLGDLHGGVKTLTTVLADHVQPNTYILKNPDFHLLSIGDNINCGLYSAYLLYLLAKLKYKNPERVHCIRGNHESFSKIINGGFLDELYAQYPEISDDNIHQICRFFDTFISALIVRYRPSDELIFFSHGGFEIGDTNIVDLLNSEEKITYKIVGSVENDTIFINRLTSLEVDVSLKKELLESDNKNQIHTLCNFIPTTFDTGTCDSFQEESSQLIIGYYVNNINSEYFFDTEKAQAIVLFHGAHEYKKKPYDFFRNLFSQKGYTLTYFVRGHQHTWKIEDYNQFYHIMSHIIEGDGVYILEVPHEANDYTIITLGPAPDSKYGLPMGKYDEYEKHSPGAVLYSTVTFSYDAENNSTKTLQTIYNDILSENFITLHQKYRAANL